MDDILNRRAESALTGPEAAQMLKFYADTGIHRIQEHMEAVAEQRPYAPRI